MTEQRIRDYYRRCELTDWNYQYSDDHRVYAEGSAQVNRRYTEAMEHAILRLIYLHFNDETSTASGKPEPVENYIRLYEDMLRGVGNKDG